ncbi:hypothetical protein BKA93DRAFT_791936 [Sparassis latifolia]
MSTNSHAFVHTDGAATAFLYTAQMRGSRSCCGPLSSWARWRTDCPPWSSPSSITTQTHTAYSWSSSSGSARSCSTRGRKAPMRLRGRDGPRPRRVYSVSLPEAAHADVQVAAEALHGAAPNSTARRLLYTRGCSSYLFRAWRMGWGGPATAQECDAQGTR